MHPTVVAPDNQRRLGLPYCVTPYITFRRGTGILTGCPSPTAFALSLGPALPWEDNPSPGNLGFSAETILTSLYATHTDIRTSDTSTGPHDPASQAYGTLPYHSRLRASPSLRYTTLAPLHFRRTTTRPVSYYALFKGWLLLSQPPGCLGSRTSFTT